MSDAKRLRINWSMQEFYPDADGQYVLASDYDASLAREAALTAVKIGIDDREAGISQEAYQIFLERDGVRLRQIEADQTNFEVLNREAVALRDELEKYKGGCMDLSSQVRELEHKMDYWKGEGKRADAAEQRNAGLRQEVATLHAINEAPDENVLWDVLNATVGIITRRAYPHALESEAHNAGAKVILGRRAGLAATHLKPAESGASDKPDMRVIDALKEAGFLGRKL